jgi:HemY protein
MIQFRGWTVETSLLFAVIVLLFGFATLYVSIRLFIGARDLPPRLMAWAHRRRQRAALGAISRGFIDLLEGRWQRAEKRLAAHLDAEGGAVLACLGAARAAHEQGAEQRRDDYLRRASELAPKAEVALALVQAELQIAASRYSEARATLDRLRAMVPRNTVVLAQLVRLCAEQRDWEALLALLPAARRRKAVEEARLERLERRAWLGLLADPALKISCVATSDACSSTAPAIAPKTPWRMPWAGENGNPPWSRSTVCPRGVMPCVHCGAPKAGWPRTMETSTCCWRSAG